MQCVKSSRPSGFRMGLSALVMIAAGLMTSAAHAQDATAECLELGKKLTSYGNFMQRAQGFQKKKPTPDEACAVFTGLQSAGKAAIEEINKNGAWCHVPDQVGDNIKSQQDQIGKIRANACNVASQMKKQQQQQGGGLLGGGDVLGGPMRVPQGAL